MKHALVPSNGRPGIRAAGFAPRGASRPHAFRDLTVGPGLDQLRRG
jgi:hypothetical protein